MRVALPTSDQPSNIWRGWEANNWVAERTGYKKAFMSEDQKRDEINQRIFLFAHIINRNDAPID